jgi:hypothetical protein
MNPKSDYHNKYGNTDSEWAKWHFASYLTDDNCDDAKTLLEIGLHPQYFFERYTFWRIPFRLWEMILDFGTVDIRLKVLKIKPGLVYPQTEFLAWMLRKGISLDQMTEENADLCFRIKRWTEILIYLLSVEEGKGNLSQCTGSLAETLFDLWEEKHKIEMNPKHCDQILHYIKTQNKLKNQCLNSVLGHMPTVMTELILTYEWSETNTPAFVKMNEASFEFSGRMLSKLNWGT